jgi:hypothetical protein
MTRFFRLFIVSLLAVTATGTFAKDAPVSPVDWPTDNPIMHFEIGKFVKTGSYHNQNVFNIDVVAKNVSSKKISNISFRVYLEDKAKIRIGDAWISLTNVGPGETVKMVVTSQTLGTPTSFSIAPDHLPEELAYLAPSKVISTIVYSVPSGAKLAVDGKAAGLTPVEVKLTVGTHHLTFEKDGFSPGNFPMVVTANQLPGGSVSFELGAAQRDTVELRDGTVLTGDLQYINDTEVVMQIGGGLQKYSRNLVKKVLLVEREIPLPPNN